MPARVPFVAGNWKMHKTARQAVEFVAVLRTELPAPDPVEVVLCPPFTALFAVSRELSGSRIGLGAQDVHVAPAGAYTGEVSVEMLRDVGCTYVIVGHSERRTLCGETDAQVRDKARAALDGGLWPIVCVGETLVEREAGRTTEVVRGQVEGALRDLAQHLGQIVIAYEPVWAIGTGRQATEVQAQSAHASIRESLARLAGEPAAATTRIVYGGSLTPANARALFALPDVDGGLVGGASLEAAAFARIVEAAAACASRPK